MEGNLVAVGTVILAAVTDATLQLGLSALLLLYHNSLGKHIQKKTRCLASYYILGSATINCLLLSAICFLIVSLSRSMLSTETLGVVVTILFILAIFMFFIYYRRGDTTELWLPRKFSRFIEKRANSTESNIEAFGLGILADFAEAPFSLVLGVIAANAIISLPGLLQIITITIYTITAILPELILRLTLRRGKNVADAQRWRVKNKNFLKTISTILFITLATFIIAFRIVGCK